MAFPAFMPGGGAGIWLLTVIPQIPFLAMVHEGTLPRLARSMLRSRDSTKDRFLAKSLSSEIRLLYFVTLTLGSLTIYLGVMVGLLATFSAAFVAVILPWISFLSRFYCLFFVPSIIETPATRRAKELIYTLRQVMPCANQQIVVTSDTAAPGCRSPAIICTSFFSPRYHLLIPDWFVTLSHQNALALTAHELAHLTLHGRRARWLRFYGFITLQGADSLTALESSDSDEFEADRLTIKVLSSLHIDARQLSSALMAASMAHVIASGNTELMDDEQLISVYNNSTNYPVPFYIGGEARVLQGATQDFGHELPH
jgi:hypothetical protein